MFLALPVSFCSIGFLMGVFKADGPAVIQLERNVCGSVLSSFRPIKPSSIQTLPGKLHLSVLLSKCPTCFIQSPVSHLGGNDSLQWVVCSAHCSHCIGHQSSFLQFKLPGFSFFLCHDSIIYMDEKWQNRERGDLNELIRDTNYKYGLEEYWKD